LAGDRIIYATVNGYEVKLDLYRRKDSKTPGALTTLDRVDAALGVMFDRAGGVARVVRDTAIVITSDHGHCEVLDGCPRRIQDELAMVRRVRCPRCPRSGRTDKIRSVSERLRADRGSTRQRAQRRSLGHGAPGL
jgi:hypothetical protein